MLTHVKIVLLWADSTAAYPQQPISKMWVTWVALAFDGSRDYSSWDAEAGGCRTVMRLHQISYSSVLHGKNTQLYSALCNVVIEKTIIRNVTALHGAVYFGWLMSHSDAQRGVASPRRQFIHNNLTAHSFDCTFDYTTRGWAWRHRTDGPTGIGPYLAKDATSPPVDWNLLREKLKSESFQKTYDALWSTDSSSSSCFEFRESTEVALKFATQSTELL